MWLIQVSANQSSPWLTKGTNFTPPFFLLAIATNITVTLAIVARLFLFRWRISSLLGKKYGSHYTSVAAMLVESACLHSGFAVLFLIPYSLNSSLANTFIRVLSQVQVFHFPILVRYGSQCLNRS